MGDLFNKVDWGGVLGPDVHREVLGGWVGWLVAEVWYTELVEVYSSFKFHLFL